MRAVCLFAFVWSMQYFLALSGPSLMTADSSKSCTSSTWPRAARSGEATHLCDKSRKRRRRRAMDAGLPGRRNPSSAFFLLAHTRRENKRRAPVFIVMVHGGTGVVLQNLRRHRGRMGVASTMLHIKLEPSHISQLDASPQRLRPRRRLRKQPGAGHLSRCRTQSSPFCQALVCINAESNHLLIQGIRMAQNPNETKQASTSLQLRAFKP